MPRTHFQSLLIEVDAAKVEACLRPAAAQLLDLARKVYVARLPDGSEHVFVYELPIIAAGMAELGARVTSRSWPGIGPAAEKRKGMRA